MWGLWAVLLYDFPAPVQNHLDSFFESNTYHLILELPLIYCLFMLPFWSLMVFFVLWHVDSAVAPFPVLARFFTKSTFNRHIVPIEHHAVGILEDCMLYAHHTRMNGIWGTFYSACKVVFLHTQSNMWVSHRCPHMWIFHACCCFHYSLLCACACVCLWATAALFINTSAGLTVHSGREREPWDSLRQRSHKKSLLIYFPPNWKVHAHTWLNHHASTGDGPPLHADETWSQFYRSGQSQACQGNTASRRIHTQFLMAFADVLFLIAPLALIPSSLYLTAHLIWPTLAIKPITIFFHLWFT